MALDPPLVALLTAGLTLANTVILFFINRRSIDTHSRVNGLLLQHTAEAEARGRRLAAHDKLDRPYRGKARRARRTD